MTAHVPILVIDDDADIRDAIVDTLNDEGYAATAVAGGPAALAHLRHHPAPALILLDWNMTPMNGAHFMAEFAKEPHWAAIPVVLITADARVEDKSRVANFADYLRKPMKLPDLLTIVERYC